MEKKTYITPSIKVRNINTESLLAALSVDISDDPATGPAQTKGYDFIEDEPEVARPSYNAWE